VALADGAMPNVSDRQVALSGDQNNVPLTPLL
jgi:hypothetical protein